MHQHSDEADEITWFWHNKQQIKYFGNYAISESRFDLRPHAVAVPGGGGHGGICFPNFAFTSIAPQHVFFIWCSFSLPPPKKNNNHKVILPTLSPPHLKILMPPLTTWDIQCKYIIINNISWWCNRLKCTLFLFWWTCSEEHYRWLFFSQFWIIIHLTSLI